MAKKTGANLFTEKHHLLENESALIIDDDGAVNVSLSTATDNVVGEIENKMNGAQMLLTALAWKIQNEEGFVDDVINEFEEMLENLEDNSEACG